MTSELKPCPFCGSHAEIHGYGADKYEIACASECAVNPNTVIDDLKTCTDDWNTRALPASQPVPEVVRYDRAVYRMQEAKDGKYVRYDQHLAVIAAKDVEIERLTEKAIVGEYMWTPSEMMEVVKRAETAEAKLAQREKQEPVGYFYMHGTGTYMQSQSEFKDQPNVLPLYASPLAGEKRGAV